MKIPINSDNNNVILENSFKNALENFQKQMQGEAVKVGLFSEDDVAEWITLSRRGEYGIR